MAEPFVPCAIRTLYLRFAFFSSGALCVYDFPVKNALNLEKYQSKKSQTIEISGNSYWIGFFRHTTSALL